MPAIEYLNGGGVDANSPECAVDLSVSSSSLLVFPCVDLGHDWLGFV